PLAPTAPSRHLAPSRIAAGRPHPDSGRGSARPHATDRQCRGIVEALPQERASMQRKVMISCAVTGSADSPGKNPAVPVTPEQIAASCIDAAKAGAAIVHIHVRDPKTTEPSMDVAHYREVA